MRLASVRLRCMWRVFARLCTGTRDRIAPASTRERAPRCSRACRFVRRRAGRESDTLIVQRARQRVLNHAMAVVSQQQRSSTARRRCADVAARGGSAHLVGRNGASAKLARLASLAPRPGALPVHLHFRQQHSRCICILGITGATAFWVQRILPVHLHFGTLFPVRLIFGSDDSRCNCILQEVAPGATAFRRSAPGATVFWQQYSRCNCILPIKVCYRAERF